MVGIPAGIKNIGEGYSKIGEQLKAKNTGQTKWKNECRGTSIGMKIFGGGLMVAGTTTAVLVGVVTLSIPIGIAGLVGGAAFSILGYDMAEVGTNLGNLTENPVRENLTSAVKRTASKAASGFKKGKGLLDKVKSGVATVVQEAKDTAAKGAEVLEGSGGAKKVAINMTKSNLSEHTLLFGRVMAYMVMPQNIS